jgi:glycosyltransferase involved in cell wall biosynthesis
VYPVYKPEYRSYSARRLLPGLSTFPVTGRSFIKSSVAAVESHSQGHDLVYGHFLFPAGAAAVEVAKRMGVPAVVALGESGYEFYERHLGLKRMRKIARGFDGVLCVSPDNRDYAVNVLGIAEEKIIVAPNAADTDHFYPRIRAEERARLGLSPDRTIVISVGALVERKGPLRVMRAIEAMPDVGAVFLGTGPQRPEGEQVLHAGPVSSEEVPAWLSAADIFVLPTLAEGSSNAVAEAMACGLPVITTDLPSSRSMVPGEAGILIPGADADALKNAIQLLVAETDTRERMASAALATARQYTLEIRAERIRDWMATLV